MKCRVKISWHIGDNNIRNTSLKKKNVKLCLKMLSTITWHHIVSDWPIKLRNWHKKKKSHPIENTDKQQRNAKNNLQIAALRLLKDWTVPLNPPGFCGSYNWACSRHDKTDFSKQPCIQLYPPLRNHWANAHLRLRHCIPPPCQITPGTATPAANHCCQPGPIFSNGSLTNRGATSLLCFPPLSRWCE